MEANAAAHIAEQEQAEAEAMLQMQTEAKAMDAQIQAGAERAAKLNDIEERRGSQEVWALNRQAEIAIHGSRGYVDNDGTVLAEPTKGKLDEIRENPRYGTKQSDRERAAKDYLADVDDLVKDGFELSQAKLIMDLREEHDATENRLASKLERYTDSRSAAERVEKSRLRHGNEDELIEQVVRNEGLFSRADYDKFRFKHGSSKQGERKEFIAYRDSSIAEAKRDHDAAERQKIADTLRRKKLARERAEEYQEIYDTNQAEGDEPDESDESEVEPKEPETPDDNGPNGNASTAAEEPHAADPANEATGSNEPEPEPTKDGHSEASDAASAAASEPATAETAVLPVEQDGGDGAEDLPPTDEYETEPDNEQAPKSRWERLKEGFWRHMYETPIDMSPMGPTIQPDRPFEEWYADKQANKEPGRVSRSAEKTVEKLSEMADFALYMGDMALADTAYYAGNAIDSVRYASGVADDKANAVLDRIANAAGPSVERAANTKEAVKERAAYLGHVAFDRMISIPNRLRSFIKRNSGSKSEKRQESAADESAANESAINEPITVEQARREVAAQQRPWDWEEDWDWVEE